MATASLAKHLYGVKQVVGTTRNAEKVDWMKNTGFNMVLVLLNSESSLQDRAERMKVE
jgi:hypothetical protein